MGAKPDGSVCVFGAIALDRYLDALRQEILGVREAKDIECVHRMRVASRRMRSALDLFESCLPAKHFPAWEKQVRRMTGALGAARDTDVQIDLLEKFTREHAGPREVPGLRRLLLRLRQKRQKLQLKVVDALDHLEGSQAMDEIQSRIKPILTRQDQTYLYSPALYQAGYAAVSPVLDDFLSYEEVIHQAENDEGLHAMRISAKHLRYCLEIYSPLYPGELKDQIQACRKMQDALGDLHDSDVWIALLPQFLVRERARTFTYFGNLNGYFRLIPGIECFLEDRKNARQASYEEALRLWEKQADQETWTKLRDQIQMPFFRAEPPQPLDQNGADNTGETAG